MKRSRYLVGVAAGAVLALLAGCGGDSGGTGDGGVKEVTVWDRAGAEANTRKAFFEKWNEDEGKKLGLHVKYEPQATEKYEELVRLGFQTKKAPDVFHSPSSQMGAFVAAGWVQPIDKLVSKDLLSQAAPYLKPSSELVWGGKPYGVPTTTFTIRLVINRTLFKDAGLDPDKPPATFSEMEAAAKAITESAKGKAYGVGLPTAWVGFRQWNVDIPLLAADQNLAQNGLFNRSTGSYESTKYEPVVKLYANLIKNGWAYPGASTLNNDTKIGAFAQGKIGMMLDSSSIAASLKQLGSTVDMGVGPIPVPDGQTLVRSPMNAGFPYAISSLTKDAEAAAKVFEVLVGPQMQEALAAGGTAPLSAAAWDSPAAKQNKAMQLFKPAPNDQQWPKNPGGVIEVTGQNADKTLAKLILSPSANPAAALADLQSRYQKAYDDAVKKKTIDEKEFRD
jgi:multiple sugar transport system substrate-binding protein